MTPERIDQFFSFLYEGRIGEVVFWLRFAAGIVTSAVIAAMVVILVKFRELTVPPPPAPEAASPAPVQAGPPAPWREVLERIESTSPADWNLAVIRADAVLDSVLSDSLPGETLGERLKQLDRRNLTSIEGVWEAHKLRNRIAHETDRTLSYQEARRAIMLYGEALRELGYLKT